MEIYLIALLCLMNFAAFAGTRVGISLYALALGENQMVVGVLIALVAVCPMFLAVTFGKLADRIGPRPPILMGTLGLGLTLLLPTVFPGLTTLYFLSPLAGISFYLFFITATGITGGIGGSGNRVRNYALISLAFSGAGFVGPMTCGFSIDHFGHRTAFLVLAAFTVVPALVVILKPGFLPREAKSRQADEKGNVLDLCRVPTLRIAFIASGFIASANDLFQFYMPVYGYSIGLSASVIGTVIGICALATFVIRVVLPHLLKRSSESAILAGAIFLAAMAFILFPLLENVFALAAVAFLLGLGLGCGLPMSMSLIYALSPPGRVAECAGIRVTVNNFTHVAIPLIFGSLGRAFGVAPVFIVNAVMLATVGFLMRRSLSARRG